MVVRSLNAILWHIYQKGELYFAYQKGDTLEGISKRFSNFCGIPDGEQIIRCIVVVLCELSVRSRYD
jgi:hypothetical protein